MRDSVKISKVALPCSETPEQRFKRKKVEATEWSEDDIRHGIASAEEVRDIRSNTLKKRKLPDWQLQAHKQWGRLLYSYFNWRQAGTIYPRSQIYPCQSGKCSCAIRWKASTLTRFGYYCAEDGRRGPLLESQISFSCRTHGMTFCCSST